MSQGHASSWSKAKEFGAKEGETGLIVVVNKQQEGSRPPRYSVQFLSQKHNDQGEVYRSPYVPVYTSEREDKTREVRSNLKKLSEYLTVAEKWIESDLATFNASVKR